jgi:hypothetical protein
MPCDVIGTNCRTEPLVSVSNVDDLGKISGATLRLPWEGRGVGEENDCTAMEEGEACFGLDVALGVNGDATGSNTKRSGIAADRDALLLVPEGILEAFAPPLRSI